MNIETYPPEQTPEVMAAVPPSPNAPPPPQPPVQPPMPMQPAPVKQRRVGTFTLGVTLIMLGILVPLSLTLGGGMWKLMQFAPLVLLVLGVEILVYAVRFKTEKFRYDGVSVFLVVAITFVTLIGSLIAPPIANAVGFAEKESAACREARSALEQEMAASNSDGYVSVYNGDSNGWEYVTDKYAEKTDWRLTARVHFGQIDGSRTTDKEKVAQVFAAMAAAADKQGTIRDLEMEYSESGPDGVTTYQARLVGNLLGGMTPDNMEKWVNVHFEPTQTRAPTNQPTAQDPTSTEPVDEDTAE